MAGSDDNSDDLKMQLEELRQELDATRTQIEAFIDSAPDAIITISAEDYRIINFNLGAEKMFGYSFEEAIGQNPAMLMTNPNRRQHDEYVERYLRTGEKRIIGRIRPEKAVKKNGEVFDINLSVSEVDLPSGKFFNAIIRDISARVRAENELRQVLTAQQEIAETLQQSMLTLPARVPNVEFSHKYYSATEAAAVGGDIYDIFEIDENRVGFLIADAQGHGIEAAAATSLIKNGVRAFSIDAQSPAKVVSQTNELIRRFPGASKISTMIFGIIFGDSGLIRYCNAGHPEPILRKVDSASFVGCRPSLLVGAMEDVVYEDCELQLDQGDVLFLYTDGVIEARNPAEFFGEERLLKVISEGDSFNLPEWPEAIFRAVTDFSRGRLLDDVAVLTLSVKS